MDAVTAQTAGSHIEEKPSSIAWHYRLVEPELARMGLELLRAALAPMCERLGIELLDGAKVLEVRRAGVHKGLVVQEALRDAPPGALVIALGDDVTDEAMFAAMPADAVAIKVGRGVTRAGVRVAGVAQARILLAALADAPRLVPREPEEASAAPPRGDIRTPMEG
jgi:trehalose 6-phosphate synthase/phosphatase